jgi:ABC-type uncharacterized transport system auxiliary subunit
MESYLMKKLSILSGLCLLLFGCSIFPKPQSPQLNYFSIGIPQQQMVKVRLVKVQSVSSLTGNDVKMHFKTSTGKIEVDPFNRWISSPVNQIQRYLTIAMAPKAASSNPLTLETKLLTFENNLTTKAVTLTLLVTVKEQREVKFEQLFTETVQVNGVNATAYANAMSRAMNNISARIAEKINSLK